MSDQFCDRRTYRKHSTDVKRTEAAKAYQHYNNLYDLYAKAVKVTVVNDNFKRLVDEFRSFYEYSAGTRPTGLVKTQWIDWYKQHH